MHNGDLIASIHKKALNAARTFQEAQNTLLDLLGQMDDLKGFIHLGYTSLFTYATEGLKLSEYQAMTLIQIARKSKEIPELKEKVKSGSITLSNAKQIAVVVTKENAQEWLEKAKTLSKRELEREVARVKPETMLPAQFHWMSGERIDLHLGVTEEVMEDILRLQDLLASKKKETIRLEDVIAFALKVSLEKHDPIEKAKRAVKRGEEKKADQSKNDKDLIEYPENYNEVRDWTAYLRMGANLPMPL